MSEESRSCPSCGARVPPTAHRCELCGTTVESEAESEEDAVPPDDDGTSVEGGGSDAIKHGDAAIPSEDGGPVYCHQCGHANPGDANYCSQCGTALEELSEGTPSDGVRPVAADLPRGEASGSDQEASSAPADESNSEDADQMAVGKRLFFMVGVGLLLVLGFFFITQWSQQVNWATDDGTDGSASVENSANTGQAARGGDGGARTGSGPGAPSTGGGDPETTLSALVDELSGELDGPVASKIDSVRQQMEAGSESDEQELRGTLVRLYIGAGAPGRAALEQSTIADRTGDVDDRRRAADLLYRWMRQVEQERDRAAIAKVARHVATAYEEVAREAPQDLDARTRMGEAYLLTNNPMKGIQAINAVLEDDSTFVPARFQKGLALLQINRLDQAVQQFERVKAHADPDEPFYKQAERAIEVINEETSNDGQSSGVRSN